MATLPLALISLPFVASALTPLNSQPAQSPPATTPLQHAWQTTASGLFDEANIEFASAQGDEARLGEAVTMILRQPKTNGNLHHAATLLANLIRRSPGSPSSIGAYYYLGRIEQTHRNPPNLPEAKRIFRELIAAHPGHPYADLATVKLAIIELYEPLSPDERRSRFDALVALAPGLRSRSSRRDLSMLLADTAQRFGYAPSITLDLLLAADQLGIARRSEQGNTWVRIGQLAEEAGRIDVARSYYEKCLPLFVRDNRLRMVRERVAALSGSPVTPDKTTP